MNDASRELRALADEYWQGTLEASPESATLKGDHRYDDRLSDISPDGVQREVERRRGLLARLRSIDRGSLPDPDRVTYVALEEELAIALEVASCQLEEWLLSSRYGPHIELMNLAELTPIRTPLDGRNLLARFGKVPAYIDQYLANLRRGLARGRVAPRRSVNVLVRQLDQLLSSPPDTWPLGKRAAEPHQDWPAGEADAFARELLRLAEAEIAPAFARLRDGLRDEIAPRARDDDHAGISNVDGGLLCYARLCRMHTTLEAPADELHQFGLDEVARLRAELVELGGRALGTSDVAEIQRRLRSDPALHFRTREEVEEKAREALARARAAMPRWFGRLPQAPCEVIRVPDYEEKDTTIAYYREPAIDGSRPGYYYINTYEPETRPRYEAEVLAFHESIPGHHLQLAIAQELTDLPEFRRYEGATSFVEGWGLYTERLAAEMGLYSGDVDRLGLLSFDLWRACRLVVDTGIHARGWSRQRAVAYMVENTLLAENNVENEVDRYIDWPGQALAYKVGQREILRLRRQAQDALGPRFDIKGFHDAVLENGALSMPALQQAVGDWIRRQR